MSKESFKVFTMMPWVISEGKIVQFSCLSTRLTAVKSFAFRSYPRTCAPGTYSKAASTF